MVQFFSSDLLLKFTDTLPSKECKLYLIAISSFLKNKSGKIPSLHASMQECFLKKYCHIKD